MFNVSFTRRTFIATAAVLVGVAAMPRSQATWAGERAGDLGDAEFKKLCETMHVKNQPWAAVPWKVSVTDARRAAAEAKKPIFLMVNTGNCLGFV